MGFGWHSVVSFLKQATGHAEWVTSGWHRICAGPTAAIEQCRSTVLIECADQRPADGRMWDVTVAC